MRKAGFYFCGAILSVSALVLGAGCGPGENGATGGAGGGASSTSTSTANEANSSSSTSTPASSSSGSSAVSCDSYCNDITNNCKGDLAQYTSLDACKTACSKITKIGTPDDKSGATLGCHAYHAGMPSVMDAKTHCPHAGPTGGDKIVSDMMGSACGEGCENFCDMAMAACGDQKTYADTTACITDCRKFKDTTQDAYNATYYAKPENWKNDFGCRAYHLTVAAGGGDLAKTHCPHITSTSMACTK